MIIAPQHKPDHWLPKDTEYQPACAWPEDCLVQWGSSGVVICRDGNNYRTAFFEAFPRDNAGGFIRGEGADIAAAETDAFTKYQRELACQHRWGRRGYLNGGALCWHCGAFRTVFQPVHELGHWRRPLNRMEQEFLELLVDPITPEGRKHQAVLLLRKKVFGVEGERRQ